MCLAPHTQCNIDKLEAVQRRAARFVIGDFRSTSSVTQMLTTLKWDSLNYRRKMLRQPETVEAASITVFNNLLINEL